MRPAATRMTNRAWLFIIGLLMLLAGVAALCLGITQVNEQARDWTGLELPAANSTVFAPDTIGMALASNGAALLVGLGGLLVGLLGLIWLIFQLPRSDRPPVLQLHDDARKGLIRCDAKVISRALEERLAQLPGVAGVDATIKGTAKHLRALIDLDVDQRSELREVTGTVVERVRADLATALESEVDELRVRVNAAAASTSSDRVAVIAGAGRNAVESRSG